MRKHAPDSTVTRLAFLVREVAARTGVPVSTLHDLIRRGLINTIQIGADGAYVTGTGIRKRRPRLILIPADALDAFLARHRVKARP